MLEFLQNFFWNGFTSGNYEYKTIHILAILFTISLAVILPIYFKNKSEKSLWRFLQSLAALTLITYISRRVISFTLGGNHSFDNFIRTFWLFYLCNINTVILSVMILVKAKKGYEYVMITGFIGGVVTFLIPDGIYIDKYLTFSIFDSVLSHFILVVVPPIFIVKKIWRPNYKKSWQVILGMLVVVFNVEVVQRLFFGNNYIDYLFFHSDMPFVIKKHPELQFLVISSLFLIVLGIIYGINQLIITMSYKYKIKNSYKLEKNFS